MLQITETIPTHLAERLLRCGRTRRYWQNGGWTVDPRAASVFADTIGAVRACIDHGLRDIELVLRTPGTHVEIFSAVVR